MKIKTMPRMIMVILLSLLSTSCATVWTSEQTVDDIDGKKMVRVTIEKMDMVGKLVIYCNNNTLIAYVSNNYYFSSGINEITWKFDNDEPLIGYSDYVRSSKLLYFDDESTLDLVKGLLVHDYIKMKVDGWRIEFNLDGAKARILPVLQACNINTN